LTVLVFFTDTDLSLYSLVKTYNNGVALSIDRYFYVYFKIFKSRQSRESGFEIWGCVNVLKLVPLQLDMDNIRHLYAAIRLQKHPVRDQRSYGV